MPVYSQPYVIACRLLSQLIGLTDFIFSQDCRDELEKLTAATTAKAQVGMCPLSYSLGMCLSSVRLPLSRWWRSYQIRTCGLCTLKMTVGCIQSVLALHCWEPTTSRPQPCSGSQPHTFLTSAPCALQALLDSSSKGEEGVPLQKLMPAMQTSRSQASLLKESRSQASLKASQA